jgi:hypothetical protein
VVAPPKEPYGFDDDGYVDRSVLVIVIGPILERTRLATRREGKTFPFSPQRSINLAMCAILTGFLLGAG